MTKHPTDPQGDILALHGGTKEKYGQGAHSTRVICNCGRWFRGPKEDDALSRWEAHVHQVRGVKAAS